jgi:hypothetical protein
LFLVEGTGDHVLSVPATNGPVPRSAVLATSLVVDDADELTAAFTISTRPFFSCGGCYTGLPMFPRVPQREQRSSPESDECHT